MNQTLSSVGSDSEDGQSSGRCHTKYLVRENYPCDDMPKNQYINYVN